MPLVYFLGNGNSPAFRSSYHPAAQSLLRFRFRLAFLALNLERMLAVRRVCADGFFLALLSGLSFSQNHFMYFYGRLQPLTLLPLGPESGNRKLLLIMLLTLCCQHRSTPSVPTPCVCLRSCLWSYADGRRCWLV